MLRLILMPRSVFVGSQSERTEVCSNRTHDTTTTMTFLSVKRIIQVNWKEKEIKLFLFASLAKGLYRTGNDGTCSLSFTGVLMA